MTWSLGLVDDLLGGLALASLGLWAARPSVRLLLWREVRFPATLRAQQVEALLAHVAARREPVVFVIDARDQSIRFRLGAPRGAIESMTSALAGIAPELRLDTAEAATAVAPKAGARAWWSGSWPLLRTEAVELAVAGLLGQLSSLGKNEQMQLTIRLEVAHAQPSPGEMDAGVKPAIAAKRSGPLMRAELLLTLTAVPEVRARQLLQSVAGRLRTATGRRGRLRLRRLSAAAAARARRRIMTGQRRLFTPTTVLSPSELVPLLGWPIGAPRIAGLSYGVAPRLIPLRDLPTGGRDARVIAVSTWPAAAGRRLAQPVIGALQHTAVIGPTGSGKSSLLRGLIEQDLVAGRGALVLDAKGDLVDDVLARIPEGRRGDVIVLDPAAGGPQPGLRLFPRHGDHELAADLLLGTLSRIYADSWGIRTSSYLRLGLTTLAEAGEPLPLLPAVFTDRALRQRLLRRVSDPLLLASWQRFEALSAADQATQLAAPLRKIEELVGRGRLRVVLGQIAPRLNFAEVLARGRIVLVRLPSGLLGAGGQLLASLLLWQFFTAVEARSALPETKRRPFFAYVDEVGALGGLPLPLDGLLERARGHGVGLTLAPQSLSQLPQSLRSALLANVGSLVAFRLAADEAKAVARELPELTGEQLQHLERFEVALRLSRGPGDVTATMTGKTLPPSAPSSDAAAIRTVAGERWGATLEQVDAELARRLGVAPSDRGTSDDDAAGHSGFGAVGVRRRQP